MTLEGERDNIGAMGQTMAAPFHERPPRTNRHGPLKRIERQQMEPTIYPRVRDMIHQYSH